MARIPPKLLLIFNLEGALCKKVPASAESLTNLDPRPRLLLRPDLEGFLRWMFIKNKIFFKVGVWTDTTSENTEKLVETIFGRFAGGLLFKYASPSEQGLKDLQRVWYNYQMFNDSTTVYIDYKDAVVQKKNQLLLKEYDEDNTLIMLQDYFRFFSFQFHHKQVHSLTDFMIKTPFILFMNESNKKAPENYTENSRFRNFTL